MRMMTTTGMFSTGDSVSVIMFPPTPRLSVNAGFLFSTGRGREQPVLGFGL